MHPTTTSPCLLHLKGRLLFFRSLFRGREDVFDDARLDTLLLAMPVSWRGTLQQYVGRLHRLHENKKEVQVYDYADVLVPMLARMYKKRLAGYGALGYIVAEGPRT